MLSGSAFYRNLNCLASETLSAEALRIGNVPPKETYFTRRGTRVHASQGETRDEKATASFVIGRLENEMRKFIGKSPIASEVRLYLREGLEPIFTGKPDRFACSEGGTLVCFGDLKPGFQADWEAWWAQMSTYAVLLKAKFPRAQDIIGIIATRFHSVQTRHFSTKDIEDTELLIRTTVAMHREATGNEEPTPGPWCKYCQARLICTKAMLPVLPEETPIAHLPSGLAGAEVVDKLNVLIKLCKDRLDWYKEKLRDNPDFLDGKFILGVRKVPEIKMDRETIEALGLVLDPEELYQCATFSLPKLRETLCVAKGISEREAKDTLDLALGELITYKESDFLLKK